MVLTNRPRLHLGPMTTQWTPPASCSLTYFPDCVSCSTGYRGQQCSGVNVEDNIECWPPRSDAPATPRPPILGWGFFSPGLGCPGGYSAACSATAGGNSNWPVEFQLSAGETALGCCPIGFSCSNLFGNTCIQARSTGVLSIATCSNGNPLNLTPRNIPFTETTTAAVAQASASNIRVAATSYTIQTFTIYAPMFQVHFQSTDIPSSSTSSFSQSNDPSPTRSATSDTVKPEDESDSAGGLSTGAKVGIGISVATVIIGIAIAILFLVRLRRKRSTSMAQQIIERKVQTVHSGLVQQHKPPQEMPASHFVSELEANAPRHAQHEGM